jgi:16S rRNA processing protein RimM
MHRRRKDTPYVTVGRVLKPRGPYGWVGVEKLTTNPRRFSEGQAFILEGNEQGERLVLEEIREEADKTTVRFRGVESREEASAIAGKLLLVTRQELGDSPQGSYWEHQLMGLVARTEEGEILGEVVEVIETGANDVLVVEGEREYLIPAVEEVVVRVDLEEGCMVIRPMPGLLEG